MVANHSRLGQIEQIVSELLFGPFAETAVDVLGEHFGSIHVSSPGTRREARESGVFDHAMPQVIHGHTPSSRIRGRCTGWRGA